MRITNPVVESSNAIREPDNGGIASSSHDSAALTSPNSFARLKIKTPERRSLQQPRMVHTLPAPTAQNIQLRVSQAEERELGRTEAASWAQMTPLMAAIFGPLSILLGIPSLTQRWRGQLLDPPVLSNGVSNVLSLPDPTLELALSAISLFVEVLANTLLVLRFSNFHTKWTTWISYWFWIAKIILDIANYIQFSIRHPETEEIIYLEGYWVYPLEASFM